MVEEEGYSYIAGYVTGDLLQMFLGGMAVKGADTTADIGKGAKFGGKTGRSSYWGRGGRSGSDVWDMTEGVEL